MGESMTSSRPYLIRAIHEWIGDNGLTPYVLVNAELPGSVLPQQFIENGKIVLNISAGAIDGLHIDDDWVLFSARFNGQAMDVSIPIAAVLAIYAKENGQGMVLDREDSDGLPPPPPGTKSTSKPDKKSEQKPTKKPHLQLVK
jgi:stringent starvation protein B